MRHHHTKYTFLFVFTLFLGAAPGCGEQDVGGTTDAAVPDDAISDAAPGPDAATLPLCDGDPADLVRPTGWAVESHCSGVVPDYDRLFDDTVVHRFDITIDPADYQAAVRAVLGL